MTARLTGIRTSWRNEQVLKDVRIMNLGTTRALRGPNIWSQLTVLEVEIDLSSHTQRSTQDIDAIRIRTASLLPGLLHRDWS